MPEEMIVRHCAPTLAGIKTGSLFSCPYRGREELLADIRRLNLGLVPKGLCLLPLRYHQGRALVYLFRPADLRRDLSHRDAAGLLEETGYAGKKVSQCLVQLIQRFQECQGFPHEIGLFLSYPPEDVRGFIENKAKNFKCVGYWKVYGDAHRAQLLFEKYRKCTDLYCRRWRAGDRIDQLAVPV